MKIRTSTADFAPEPILKPFGFKGGYLSELWQTRVELTDASGARGVPCFCADLTVSPAMVEWNKAVAARLDAFPGLKGLGLVETNGEQNYVNWERMRTALPRPDAPWTRTRRGCFELDETYWKTPFFGGIA